MTIQSTMIATAIACAAILGGGAAGAQSITPGFPGAQKLSDYPPVTPAVAQQRARSGCTQLEQDAGMAGGSCGTVPLNAVASAFFDRTSDDDED
jgi:hypothetical protein